ncbi:hypothetical protein [Faecalibacillus intestinalis]|jgi:hypothetical protein|nr:hypothetical protein [Faecalibacillus intestinalis]
MLLILTSTVEDTSYVAQINKEYKGAKLQFGNDANELTSIINA